MLLVISEREAYSSESLELVLESIFESRPSNIYVLIHSNSTFESHVTVASFIDMVGRVYDQSSKIKAKHNVETPVTVLIEEEKYDTSLASELWSSLYYTSNVVLDTIDKVYTQHINKENIHLTRSDSIKEEKSSKGSKPQVANPESEFAAIPVVAVGGTFDHLHDGHKILLSASAFLTEKTLIVGVTGPELLKKKQYLEYMQSYNERVKSVETFLHKIRPSLMPDVYQINDICGPTAKIENVDALVVSLESSKGADYVNNVRSQLGWKELQVYTIGVVGGSDSDKFENKLSSTGYRRLEYLKDHPEQ
ncbi:hypothetical protein PMKS-002695 [Pichia membranifaciens]|uniref:Cytidyltransferase-like domain-containing protein n=1 Tax=Pichia membranifaciens TaxID=4926 RepID=A0A1Q2YIL8_9ASCO|nr:hypothetical protein PMKS-002695 [Pichia membranifaciens]